MIFTTLVVREDSLSLFGFQGSDELEVFDLLTRVNGVGPKSALGVLSTLRPTEIARAVSDEDDGAFRAVPGIGPKTAKLIIVSLAGKLETRLDSRREETGASMPSRSSVLVALMGLGWPERHAERALREVIADDPAHSSLDVQALLRLALARLGPAHREGVRS